MDLVDINAGSAIPVDYKAMMADKEATIKKFTDIMQK